MALDLSKHIPNVPFTPPAKHIRPATGVRRDLLCVKHFVRTATVLLAGHFVGHTSWYAFGHLSHVVGADPSAVVALAAGPVGVPVAIGIVIAGTKIEDRIHEAAHR